MLTKQITKQISPKGDRPKLITLCTRQDLITKIAPYMDVFVIQFADLKWQGPFPPNVFTCNLRHPCYNLSDPKNVLHTIPLYEKFDFILCKQRTVVVRDPRVNMDRISITEHEICTTISEKLSIPMMAYEDQECIALEVQNSMKNYMTNFNIFSSEEIRNTWPKFDNGNSLITDDWSLISRLV